MLEHGLCGSTCRVFDRCEKHKRDNMLVCMYEILSLSIAVLCCAGCYVSHTLTGDNGKLLVGILPVAHFCSGHAFFVQKLQDYLQIKPYAVHATFQFSGTPGKRHRFREAQLWDEKHEYFHQLGELIEGGSEGEGGQKKNASSEGGRKSVGQKGGREGECRVGECG